MLQSQETSPAGTLPSFEALDQLADDIAAKGWSVIPNFLPETVRDALISEVASLREDDALRPAGIGRGDEFQVKRNIRGDLIRWMDAARPSTAEQHYLDAMEALRLHLNRHLFLGLFRYEGHTAVYPPGTFYQRHLDTFRDHGAGRLLSCIYYLNKDWQREYGGQLRLYFGSGPDAPFHDVQPEAGTFACFLSEQFEHEVLTAARERMSVTGWFSYRI